MNSIDRKKFKSYYDYSAYKIDALYLRVKDQTGGLTISNGLFSALIATNKSS
jgi:hypothetical protein